MADPLENLNELDANEPETEGADPWADQAEAEQQEAEAERAKLEAAQAGAAWAVGAVETLVNMKWPYVVIEQGSRQALQEKTAAVAYKHGAGLPAWLEPYREEIELGMVLAGVGYGVMIQVAQHENDKHEKEQWDKYANPTGEPEPAQ